MTGSWPVLYHIGHITLRNGQSGHPEMFDVPNVGSWSVAGRDKVVGRSFNREMT